VWASSTEEVVSLGNTVTLAGDDQGIQIYSGAVTAQAGSRR
jgi:hypothetical protein